MFDSLFSKLNDYGRKKIRGPKIPFSFLFFSRRRHYSIFQQMYTKRQHPHKQMQVHSVDCFASVLIKNDYEKWSLNWTLSTHNRELLKDYVRISNLVLSQQRRRPFWNESSKNVIRSLEKKKIIFSSLWMFVKKMDFVKNETVWQVTKCSWSKWKFWNEKLEYVHPKALNNK